MVSRLSEIDPKKDMADKADFLKSFSKVSVNTKWRTIKHLPTSGWPQKPTPQPLFHFPQYKSQRQSETNGLMGYKNWCPNLKYVLV